MNIITLFTEGAIAYNHNGIHRVFVSRPVAKQKKSVSADLH